MLCKVEKVWIPINWTRSSNQKKMLSNQKKMLRLLLFGDMSYLLFSTEGHLTLWELILVWPVGYNDMMPICMILWWFAVLMWFCLVVLSCTACFVNRLYSSTYDWADNVWYHLVNCQHRLVLFSGIASSAKGNTHTIWHLFYHIRSRIGRSRLLGFLSVWHMWCVIFQYHLD